MICPSCSNSIPNCIACKHCTKHSTGATGISPRHPFVSIDLYKYLHGIDKFKNSASTESATDCLGYDDFLKTYNKVESSRRQHFSSKRTKRIKVDQVKDVVIGVSEMDEQLKPIWRSKIFIKVNTAATSFDILNAALLKKSLHDQHFSQHLQYALLYKDGSRVDLLPESQEPFSLKKYKEELMVDYAKITLYITPSDNLDCLRDADCVAAVSGNSCQTVGKRPVDTEKDDSFHMLIRPQQGKQTLDSTKQLSRPHCDAVPGDSPLIIRTPQQGTLTDDSTRMLRKSQHDTAVVELISYVDSESDFERSPLPVTGRHAVAEINTGAAGWITAGTPTVLFRTMENVNYDEMHRDATPTTFMFESTSSDLHLAVLREETLPDIVGRLNSAISSDGIKNIVNVDRSDVLDGGLRAFRRSTFNPFLPLNVRFSGENGIDTGGLSREFLRLALKQLSESHCFVGHTTAKFIEPNFKVLSEKTYAVVGKLMAYSIVHNGPMPQFLHSEMYRCISEGVIHAKPTVSDISDTALQQQIKKVLIAVDDEGYAGAVAPLEDMAALAGCLNMTLHVVDKEMLAQSLTHFYVVGRASLAIDQFKEGLSCLGLLDAVRTNSDTMQPAFVYAPSPLDATIVEDLFVIHQWSEKGSNHFNDEKRAQTHWRDFLQDVEGNGQLQLILIFATGLDNVPPLGFDPTPSATFLHADDTDTDDHRRNFPQGNTCTNQLRLPIVSTYNTFYENMMAALTIANTFSDV